MSVFRFINAWEPTLQASAAQSMAQDAKQKARSIAQDVEELRGQIDRLQMVCEAVWTVLKRQTGTTDDELARMVEEIDLRDGKVDGRSKVTAENCKRCGRAVSIRTQVCIYCGTWNARKRVF